MRGGKFLTTGAWPRYMPRNLSGSRVGTVGRLVRSHHSGDILQRHLVAIPSNAGYVGDRTGLEMIRTYRTGGNLGSDIYRNAPRDAQGRKRVSGAFGSGEKRSFCSRKASRCYRQGRYRKAGRITSNSGSTPRRYGLAYDAVLMRTGLVQFLPPGGFAAGVGGILVTEQSREAACFAIRWRTVPGRYDRRNGISTRDVVARAFIRSGEDADRTWCAYLVFA